MNQTSPEPDPFRILFVCTGNTCRSPMAEALARRLLDGRGWEHVTVASAGTAGYGGSPASDGARRAAERHGLDLSEHRSQGITPEVLAEADLILTMSPGHLIQVVEAGAGDRATLLTAFAAGEENKGGPVSVPDPFGGPPEVYEEIFRLLETLVERALLRLEPMLAP